MKFAAIDIGSNSIHLIIVEIYPDGHYIVVDRAKDMVGLARNTLANGFLSDEAIARGLECLKTFQKMCQAHEVTGIEAVATSAVREALNGKHFIQQAKERTGIDIRVVSGKEEAMLIYKGARDHIDWCGRRGLIVDIGGGSVEFIVGDATKADAVMSIPLGVRRLSEQFLETDPPKRSELKRLKHHITAELASLEELVAQHHIDFVIGTSGTLTKLARTAARREGRPFERTHGLWTSLQELKEMARALSGLREAERASFYGVGQKRTDTIVAGAQLMKYALRAVGHDSYVACEYALRDGIVADFISRASQKISGAAPHMRKRSVQTVLNRFNTYGNHPRTVARLSLEIFDQLQSFDGNDETTRELLEYAALLHDAGRAINVDDHPQHSAYIIQNANLRGFSDKERLLMALAVRHHMASGALLEDPEFKGLKSNAKARAKLMAATLQLADGLDRARSQNVKSAVLDLSDEAVTLRVGVEVDTGLELRALEQRRASLESLLGKKLIVEFGPVEPS